ncbi:uncharacterized protein GGS22DRAFT_186654 [Annulohypoxylon maeteangense]|uniref:uncharacterized protein n=1 Tax=Annulohypoxylon maeteangense TaxID=1927788 RepID=UPI002007F8EB|nr:uncharacterized protein GGS22DRAFT_186654 [Annulohypoxylon maeteangense]KAI0886585.1 hypothetical protein GGS22DRAFT_186654 [Annulohypoxylon maeteangense]
MAGPQPKQQYPAMGQMNGTFNPYATALQPVQQTAQQLAQQQVVSPYQQHHMTYHHQPAQGQPGAQYTPNGQQQHGVHVFSQGQQHRAEQLRVQHQHRVRNPRSVQAPQGIPSPAGSQIVQQVGQSPVMQYQQLPEYFVQPQISQQLTPPNHQPVLMAQGVSQIPVQPQLFNTMAPMTPPIGAPSPINQQAAFAQQPFNNGSNPNAHLSQFDQSALAPRQVLSHQSIPQPQRIDPKDAAANFLSMIKQFVETPMDFYIPVRIVENMRLAIGDCPPLNTREYHDFYEAKRAYFAPFVHFICDNDPEIPDDHKNLALLMVILRRYNAFDPLFVHHQFVEAYQYFASRNMSRQTRRMDSFVLNLKKANFFDAALYQDFVILWEYLVQVVQQPRLHPVSQPTPQLPPQPPQPVPQLPQPIPEQPLPIPEQPAPVEQPDPVEQPAPVQQQPAPVQEQPQPTQEQQPQPQPQPEPAQQQQAIPLQLDPSINWDEWLDPALSNYEFGALPEFDEAQWLANLPVDPNPSSD